MESNVLKCISLQSWVYLSCFSKDNHPLCCQRCQLGRISLNSSFKDFFPPEPMTPAPNPQFLIQLLSWFFSEGVNRRFQKIIKIVFLPELILKLFVEWKVDEWPLSICTIRNIKQVVGSYASSHCSVLSVTWSTEITRHHWSEEAS